MPVHYNLTCTHNATPVANARELWAQGDIGGALVAIERAKREPVISAYDNMSLRLHELLLAGVRRQLMTVELYPELHEIYCWLKKHGHPDFAIEVHMAIVELATALGETHVAAAWQARFLQEHASDARAICNLWLLQAHLAMKFDADAAWPYFKLALDSIPPDASLCMREAFARQAAMALIDLDRREEARELLRPIVPVLEDDGSGEGWSLETLAYTLQF